MNREEARIADLLDRRTAAMVARPALQTADAPPRRALILWGLDDSLFGTEVEAVAAVIPFAGCARVPGRVPGHASACLGVIGRAGRFYSVICMRRLTGAGATDRVPGHLLLLRGPPPHLALGVDRVFGRFELDAAALMFEGRLVAPCTPAYVRGLLEPDRLSPAPPLLETMPP